MKPQNDIIELDALQRELAKLPDLSCLSKAWNTQAPPWQKVRIFKKELDGGRGDHMTDMIEYFEVIAEPIQFGDGEGNFWYRWKVKAEFVVGT